MYHNKQILCFLDALFLWILAIMKTNIYRPR